jgi:hypothetical protein
MNAVSVSACGRLLVGCLPVAAVIFTAGEGARCEPGSSIPIGTDFGGRQARIRHFNAEFVF